MFNNKYLVDLIIRKEVGTQVFQLIINTDIYVIKDHECSCFWGMFKNEVEWSVGRLTPAGAKAQ